MPDFPQMLEPDGSRGEWHVAVLTKVVQEQQKTIADLSKKMGELERDLKLKNHVALVSTDMPRLASK